MFCVCGKKCSGAVFQQRALGSAIFCSAEHLFAPVSKQVLPSIFLSLDKNAPKGWSFQLTKPFLFFPFLLYVGCVPTSNHLGKFVTDWRCKFLLQFCPRFPQKKMRVFVIPFRTKSFQLFVWLFSHTIFYFVFFFLVHKLISQNEINTLFSRGWTRLGLVTFASTESGLDLQGTHPSRIRKSSNSDLHPVSLRMLHTYLCSCIPCRYVVGTILTTCKYTYTHTRTYWDLDSWVAGPSPRTRESSPGRGLAADPTSTLLKSSSLPFYHNCSQDVKFLAQRRLARPLWAPRYSFLQAVQVLSTG